MGSRQQVAFPSLSPPPLSGCGARDLEGCGGELAETALSVDESLELGTLEQREMDGSNPEGTYANMAPYAVAVAVAVAVVVAKRPRPVADEDFVVETNGVTPNKSAGSTTTFTGQ